MTKASWVESICLAYTSLLLFMTKGSQYRNSNRAGTNLEAGADAEATEGAADWLAPHGLLSLLSYRTRTTRLRMAPPTVGRALSHQSPIKKSPYLVLYYLVSYHALNVAKNHLERKFVYPVSNHFNL